jgi:hypothetical protein
MTLSYQEIIDRCYCGNGPQKLEKARDLYSIYGQSLLAQPDIVTSIAILQNAVERLDAHMTAMEMGANCSICAATPRGGCCSAYMGHENNDVIQLLMNMLGGVDVRIVRIDDVECCFLADNGCLLPFKPIFCLNYLCERIQKNSKSTDLKTLEEKTGTLLGLQVSLEQEIISKLQAPR